MYDPEPKFQSKAQPRVQSKITVPSYIKESGQVANWLFYNGAGDTLYDFSDYNNDGEFNGDPEWNDEYSSWVVYFDGDGDYVLVGDSPELRFSTEDFTVMFWLYFIRRSDDYAAFFRKQSWG